MASEADDFLAALSDSTNAMLESIADLTDNWTRGASLAGTSQCCTPSRATSRCARLGTALITQRRLPQSGAGR